MKIHPDFICVGPEKTGTSWLYRNLKYHPKIYLPPVKELRYFFEKQWYPDETFLGRLSSYGDWHTKQYRRYLRNRFVFYIKNPFLIYHNNDRFIWDWRFIFGRRNDNWYLSLFSKAVNRVAGEISPQYFFLPEKQIQNIKTLVPGAKIIIILRNPVDWCWSFARMSIIGEKNVDKINEQDLKNFFNTKINNCRFSNTIKLWRKHHSFDNIFIGFHDELIENPVLFLNKICNFLGVDITAMPEYSLNRISEVINKGEKHQISEEHLRYLAEGWIDEVRELGKMFSPYPQKWESELKIFL